MDLIAPTHDLAALAQVVLIDITLAGDNAVVVGMAVAGLPARHKRRAIVLGHRRRDGCSASRSAPSHCNCWRSSACCWPAGSCCYGCAGRCTASCAATHRRFGAGRSRKTLTQAMLQIVLADLSMSLDNVLAVAGAASGSTWVLVLGLLLSVVLMGVAANLLAAVLERQRWIAWLGLLIVLYVAVSMIWDGWGEVAVALHR